MVCVCEGEEIECVFVWCVCACEGEEIERER